MLRALETVRRSDFVPADFERYANRDVALPIMAGRTCLSPFAAARLLVAAEIRPEMRVLEIGTGCGFVAALLAQLAGAVLTLEPNPAVAEAASERLAGFDRVTVGIGGSWPDGDEAPFDRVIVPATIDALPDRLWRHVAPAGFVVYGLADRLQPGRHTLVVSRPDRDGSPRHSDRGPIRLPIGRVG